MTTFCKTDILKVSNRLKVVVKMFLEDLETRYAILGEMLFKLAGLPFTDSVRHKIVMDGISNEMQSLKDQIKELKR